MKKVYFHILKDGQIENQGEVITELPLGFLEIQYYSFLTGEPTNKAIVNGKNFDWRFYTDHRKFLKAYEDNQRKYYPELT